MEAEFDELIAPVYRRAMESPDQKLALDAAEKVWDRVFGKTPQPIMIAALVNDTPGDIVDS